MSVLSASVLFVRRGSGLVSYQKQRGVSGNHAARILRGGGVLLSSKHFIWRHVLYDHWPAAASGPIRKMPITLEHLERARGVEAGIIVRGMPYSLQPMTAKLAS